MGKRILVAVVGIPILLVVFLGLPVIWLTVLCAALSVIAMHEALWATGVLGRGQIRILIYSMLAAGLIPFWSYWGGDMKALLCGIFCYVLVLLCEALASRYTLTLEKLGAVFFCSLVIPYFLSAFVRVGLAYPGFGSLINLLPVASAFMSDAFALFAGMAFGKHKLAPTLSPKKTVEGAVGGVVGSILICLLFGWLLNAHGEIAEGLAPVSGSISCYTADYLKLVVYGVLGSVIAQLGDLFFSYIKRQYDLKDFGRIFPGHGGVLDRFDSVIFCAPLFELLLWLLPAFESYAVSGIAMPPGSIF